jgi:hypothetical protein
LGGDAVAAGNKQLGSCAAGYIYLYSEKLILAAMNLRRVGIDGRSYAAAPTTQILTLAPAEQYLGMQKGGGGGRDTAIAGDKQLCSFATGKMKYTSLCVQW